MSRSIPTEDRISSLPDPIVCHILSFLPTKNSAATSILSKRWKPLWLSVSTLDFMDETFPNYDSFFKFVSSVLLSRDITLPLQSFNLICEKASSLHQHDINRFLQAAVQRGIENLHLEMTIHAAFEIKLPPIIFSCKTLVVIHLKGLLVNGISQVIVDFPLLKTLHLSFVTFEYDEYLLKLLSGCPILEELQIDWIDGSYVGESLVLAENFQCLPNLIRANIYGLLFRSVNVLITLLCRAKILCVELEDAYNHLPMFQNLIHMELILSHKRCEEWQWVREVLRRCPKLQNLTIHEDSVNQDEGVCNWMDPTIVPECLSTQLKICLLKGCKCTDCELQFAKFIMQNAKELNTISIKSSSSICINVKYQMITKMASSTRASATCKLLFE